MMEVKLSRLLSDPVTPKQQEKPMKQKRQKEQTLQEARNQVQMKAEVLMRIAANHKLALRLKNQADAKTKAATKKQENYEDQLKSKN